jgi:hypothetical protein
MLIFPTASSTNCRNRTESRTQASASIAARRNALLLVISSPPGNVGSVARGGVVTFFRAFGRFETDFAFLVSTDFRFIISSSSFARRAVASAKAGHFPLMINRFPPAFTSVKHAKNNREKYESPLHSI